MIVFDTSAFLCFILDEPGAELVEARIGDGWMSTVNMAEVVSKIVERGGDAVEANGLFAQHLTDRISDYDMGQAMQTGRLRQSAIHRGLSLGDRACLALARAFDAPVLTADRAWADLDIGVQIEVIR